MKQSIVTVNVVEASQQVPCQPNQHVYPGDINHPMIKGTPCHCGKKRWGE